MKRSEVKRIQDILESADDLAELVELGIVDFHSNKFSTLAGAKLLENIGEACGHLSEELKSSFPDIEWKKIIGMRILIAHSYHRVDSDFIWIIANTSVPELAAELRARFPDLEL